MAAKPEVQHVVLNVFIVQRDDPIMEIGIPEAAEVTHIPKLHIRSLRLRASPATSASLRGCAVGLARRLRFLLACNASLQTAFGLLLLFLGNEVMF